VIIGGVGIVPDRAQPPEVLFSVVFCCLLLSRAGPSTGMLFSDVFCGLFVSSPGPELIVSFVASFVSCRELALAASRITLKTTRSTSFSTAKAKEAANLWDRRFD
jgi:hypothetical protein